MFGSRGAAHAFRRCELMQHPSSFFHRTSHIPTNGNGIVTTFALCVAQDVSHKYMVLPHKRVNQHHISPVHVS